MRRLAMFIVGMLAVFTLIRAFAGNDLNVAETPNPIVLTE